MRLDDLFGLFNCHPNFTANQKPEIAIYKQFYWWYDNNIKDLMRILDKKVVIFKKQELKISGNGSYKFQDKSNKTRLTPQSGMPDTIVTLRTVFYGLELFLCFFSNWIWRKGVYLSQLNMYKGRELYL